MNEFSRFLFIVLFVTLAAVSGCKKVNTTPRDPLKLPEGNETKYYRQVSLKSFINASGILQPDLLIFEPADNSEGYVYDPIYSKKDITVTYGPDSLLQHSDRADSIDGSTVSFYADSADVFVATYASGITTIWKPASAESRIIVSDSRNYSVKKKSAMQYAAIWLDYMPYLKFSFTRDFHK